MSLENSVLANENLQRTKISTRHHTRGISDSRYFRPETPEQSRRDRRRSSNSTYKMAQILTKSSNLISPSSLDRSKSDKRNLNLRFLGWWTVFAPISIKSSGLCRNRLVGFCSFLFEKSHPR